MMLSVAQVVVALPVEGPFDYLIPEELKLKALVGARVLVRFAGKKRVGIIIHLMNTSAHAGALSTIMNVLDATAVFTPEFLSLADFMSARFACTAGEALTIFLPPYLRGNKKFEAPFFVPSKGTSTTELLFDRGYVKRWDILLPRIVKALDQGKGVLVLLPESSRCSAVLPKLGALVKADERVLLSQGTDKEEYLRWLNVRTGVAKLAVGFISAVFVPVKNLGLIVMIDEESPFYRSDQSPFYHARDLAQARANLEGCDLVFVSSAPSVELWQKVQEKEVKVTRLEDTLAGVKLLDLSNFKMRKGTFLSPGLRNHMEALMKENKKVLLYIQAARGVTGVMDELKKYFPAAIVAGYDKTSSILPESFDVLVGTQAVLRHRQGLKVAFAAVLDIDWEFHKHDYQASHSAFSLLTHLRQMTQGHVLLQTRHASDALLQAISSDDPDDFYAHELGLRREMGLPPFMGMVTIIIRSSDESLACAQAKSLYDILMARDLKDVVILEPQEDRTALVRGKFRFCVQLHGPHIEVLVKEVKGVLKTFHPKKDTIVTVNAA